ncbi:hypothetical protein DNH61_08175 [Paenibacillus sambharensis]|uniref:Cation efflux protein cytoplasmic domain-containing protein n=1 Tax=Paenibacillus sambharensis TaxID=1803190 RepID=A0A2W1LXQ0_9BACL|nr:hypothetical protein [Paenibacillus sambharensis]PZD96471.1 hypothetical protein DNH61_08175 [Paenibacillus sambharensis]
MNIRWKLIFRRKRWRLIWISALALMLTAGCAGQPRGVRSYGHDGYMGISSSNPNMPITGTAWSYRDDTKFVGELLSTLKGINHSRVSFEGAVMRVTLQLDNAMSREEAARITAQAEELLNYNFPRYDVEVTTNQ